MLRREIWLGVWPQDPNKKGRPLLIVSNNHRNQFSRILDVTVLKLTSLKNSKGEIKPTNSAEDVVIRLKKETIIRCGSIFTVEKSCLKHRLTQLSLDVMDKVDDNLRTVLDLN